MPAFLVAEYISGAMFVLTAALLLFASQGVPNRPRMIAAGISILSVALAINFMFEAYAGEEELNLQRAGVIKRRMSTNDRGHFQYEDADGNGSSGSGQSGSAIASAGNGSVNGDAGSSWASSIARNLLRHRQLTIGDVFRDSQCGECPELVVVGPGYFVFGAAPDDSEASPAERPARLMRLSRP